MYKHEINHLDKPGILFLFADETSSLAECLLDRWDDSALFEFLSRLLLNTFFFSDFSDSNALSDSLDSFAFS